MKQWLTVTERREAKRMLPFVPRNRLWRWNCGCACRGQIWTMLTPSRKRHWPMTLCFPFLLIGSCCVLQTIWPQTPSLLPQSPMCRDYKNTPPLLDFSWTFRSQGSVAGLRCCSVPCSSHQPRASVGSHATCVRSPLNVVGVTGER